jgi:dihydroorotase
MSYDLILKNGRVIDPASGTDRVCDIAIRDGKIAAIGEQINNAASAASQDLSGLIVTPGLIDIHVHAFGSLGFLHPDTLGILSGVTAIVDAGGAGPYNYPELEALLNEGCQTDWFCFLHLPPLGVTGANEKHHRYVRSLKSIPLARMLDWAEDGSHVRGLKIGAFGDMGIEPIQLAKSIARVLKIPLYIHIGDFLKKPQRTTTPDVMRLLDAGDMVTHVYTGVFGGPFTEGGLAAAETKEAQSRGVILDVGFGSFNFSFAMAREGFNRGVLPDTISSDLQNINVRKPAKSLCHIMSIFLNLGMSLMEVVKCATSTAATAITGEWWRGRIAVGGRADLSILRIEEGSFQFQDTDRAEISGDRRLVPVKVCKAGELLDCRPEAAQERENWLVERNDRPVFTRQGFAAEDKEFLRQLAGRLKTVGWEPEEIHECAYRVIGDVKIDLRRALSLVQMICLKRPFPQSIAIMLADLGRDKACSYMDQLLGAEH